MAIPIVTSSKGLEFIGGARLQDGKLVLGPELTRKLAASGIVDATELVIQMVSNPTFVASRIQTTVREVQESAEKLRDVLAGTEAEEFFVSEGMPEVHFGAFPPRSET